MLQCKPDLSRRRALGAISAMLAMPRAGLASGLATHSGRAFATNWRLTAARGPDLESLARAIGILFAEVDRTFSPWRTDSALSRFNALPAGTPLRSGDLATVTAAALAIARQSEGAFDPTVGPLVARWGFGPILQGGLPDWRGVSTAARDIRKTRDDLTLDLCGIAKGRALDRAADLVERSGLDDFLLELGGEFIASGRHPDGRNWRVGVDIPSEVDAPSPILRLPSGAAVATSGIWTQSYALNGTTYSHIIDVRTGSPISGALRSVTVMSETAMMADGWATALCAAGAEAGPDLASSYGVAALFLVASGTSLRQIGTGPIREFLQ